MKKSKQLERAESLAYELSLCGCCDDVEVHCILDALACAGLMLVKDKRHLVSDAYFDSLVEVVERMNDMREKGLKK